MLTFIDSDDLAHPSHSHTKSTNDPPEKDDIRIEYHPKSKKATETFRFEDYDSHIRKNLDNPIDTEPWKPFRSRLDYEVTSLIHDTHMNNSQTKTLLELIQLCIQDPGSFTINGATDLAKIWDAARNSRASGVSIFQVGSLLL
jgi:hypothetical protein